jgi:acid phosphatase
MRSFHSRVLLAAFIILLLAPVVVTATSASAGILDRIETVVVIYAENRSFDNLYGLFPNAEGVRQALKEPGLYQQTDNDGTTLRQLPRVWQDRMLLFPAGLSNRPFRIDKIPGQGLGVTTRDLVHRFYQSKEQIDDGRNDRFAAVSDAGALAMGYYDGSKLPMWPIAREYTLADHFFMGAFGGSFLNHFWLVCACTPRFDQAPKEMVAIVDPQTGLLKRSECSPRSALDGQPVWMADKGVTPEGYAVNTVQPPFQPSGTEPAENGDARLANPAPQDPSKMPLPPVSLPTIGDRLTDKHIDWAWYAEGWNAALADRKNIYGKDSHGLHAHHQPFNYFKRFDPTTAEGEGERRAHLKDGEDFTRDINSGRLPPVAFYKPGGAHNEHPGYTDVESGDRQIANIVRQLERSPQWKAMLVIVTYDENGGFWDHVPPPKGDSWGPGSRIPTIIISPFAKRHHVDQTFYDTTSILKLITRRFDLEPLPGVRANVGDLTAALAGPPP